MTNTNQHEEVRQVINELIETATSYDIDTLDRIYHDDMTVIMIDTDNNLNTANKEDFKSIFKSKAEAGDPPMDTWAKFHKIDITENRAHVLLSRKNNLTGINMILVLSIDLVFEDERWQVKREVIFLRPESD